MLHSKPPKGYYLGLSVTLKASRDVLCLIRKPKGVLYIFLPNFWDHGKPKNGSFASTRTKGQCEDASYGSLILRTI